MGKKGIRWRLILIGILISLSILQVALKRLTLGLDLQGGMHILLEPDKSKLKEGMSSEDVANRVLEIIRTRIDEFGVKEPLIQKEGKERILVQLPGIKDPQRVENIIKRTAYLEFKLVNDNEKDVSEALKGNIPPEYELLYDDDGVQPYLVKKTAELTGKYIKDAYAGVSGRGEWSVFLKFNEEGRQIFGRVTGENIGKRLAIVLDGKVKRAPVIRDEIWGDAEISGGGVAGFSYEEANDLAIVLRSGVLPTPVQIIENRIIGPSLGRDSVYCGLLAGIIGLIAVISFMCIYYRKSGLIAAFALLNNVVLMLGLLSLMDATLTLPGIAGMILTVGICVDSNILIFERIRDELRAKRSVKASIEMGYKNAFSTIIDSQITVLAATLMLFMLGSGSIKGFAITLSLGIILNLFSVLFVTKTIFNMKKDYTYISI